MNKIKAFVQSRPVAVAIGATIISFGGLAGGGVAWAATSGDSIAQNTVDSSEIQNGTLTGTDIRDETLTGADVTGLTSSDFVNGGVAGVDIKDNDVTGTDLKDGTVGVADLAPGVEDSIAQTLKNGSAFQEGQLATASQHGPGIMYNLPASMVYLDVVVPKGGAPAQVSITNNAGAVEVICVATPTAEFVGTCSAARYSAGTLTVSIEGNQSANVEVNAVRVS